MKTIREAPACLNMNDKAMWVTGLNECEAENLKASNERDAVLIESVIAEFPQNDVIMTAGGVRRALQKFADRIRALR